MKSIKAINYKSISVIAVLAIVLTITTALIPTGQSPIDYYLETPSISGQTLVALPCEGQSGVLHARHGMPLDMIWYTHCEGTHIMLDPVLADFFFWLIVVTTVGVIYKRFDTTAR